jgi:hypothetical protein
LRSAATPDFIASITFGRSSSHIASSIRRGGSVS